MEVVSSGPEMLGRLDILFRVKLSMDGITMNTTEIPVNNVL